MNDPYRILGLRHGAPLIDIQVAYRSLVCKYHPDLHPDNPNMAKIFRQIQEAYDAIVSGKSRSGTYSGDSGARRQEPPEPEWWEKPYREKPRREAPRQETPREETYTYDQWKSIFDDVIREEEAAAVERINEHARQLQEAEARAQYEQALANLEAARKAFGWPYNVCETPQQVTGASALLAIIFIGFAVVLAVVAGTVANM